MPTRTYDDDLSVATVYATEIMIADVVRSGGTVQFHGSTLDLRDNRISTYTPDQQPLLSGITAGLYGKHRAPGRPDAAPSLRISTRAYRRAWYSSAKHEIVLPGMRWSLNDMVLAHETAHAAVGVGHDQRSSHGKAWRAVYAAMVRDAVGPEASLLLLDGFGC